MAEVVGLGEQITMKCQRCDGSGKIKKYFYERISDCKYQRAFGDVQCEECNGTGEIEPTNEEWLRSAPSTEEMAERITKCAMANSWAMNETQFKSGIRGWLKEKHNGV